MLGLQDAIDRGLKSNLGLLVRESGSRAVQAERIRALSALIPFAAANLSETAQQISLATYGFDFPGLPAVSGPFGYTDFRASASQTLFDMAAIKNRRAVLQNVRAVQLSSQDGRDLVVQAVAAAYLRIIADGALLDSTRAQIATAQALYERAHDQHLAGLLPAIDELRAQVELKTQQQQLLAQENQLAKDKLVLARVIGLPNGQTFQLSDAAPYTPLEGLTAEQAVRGAYESRMDYQSAVMQVRAAETARQAVIGNRYPTLSVTADYGDIGKNLGHSHGTFAVTGSLRFALFDGGRARADLIQTEAILKQRRDELADLQGQIDFQVRTALLDLKTGADQVAVAQDNLVLATQALVQARDRFAAGVTDNVEVVQAQEAVAAANQSVVSSVYAHNLAKVSLARAVGATETSLKQFMGGVAR
jgi:outer membrane protein TolC